VAPPLTLLPGRAHSGHRSPSWNLRVLLLREGKGRKRKEGKGGEGEKEREGRQRKRDEHIPHSHFWRSAVDYSIGLLFYANEFQNTVLRLNMKLFTFDSMLLPVLVTLTALSLFIA